MKREREILSLWQALENRYADKKYEDHRTEHDQIMDTEFCGPGTFWWSQQQEYMRRAQLYYENGQIERAKQAVFKSFMVMQGMCESIIRVFGLPPEPGHSSTEDPSPWDMRSDEPAEVYRYRRNVVDG
jgi:hypothetical protein